MHKKTSFLRVISKITIFACVFCTISAWADTTTCDIDFTPVTGNSWQNGTPTPTNPVEIESIGTKVGNKYAVQVAVNYDGGVVDLGTLNWNLESYQASHFWTRLNDKKEGYVCGGYSTDYEVINTNSNPSNKKLNFMTYHTNYDVHIRDNRYTDATEFKRAMSGKLLYYQRATDETWTAPTLKTVYLDEPLRKVGDYADVLDYKNGTITRSVGVKVLDGTENWSEYTYGISTGSAISGSFVITQNDMIETTSGTSAANFLIMHFRYVGSVWNRTDPGFCVSTSKRMFFRRNTTDSVDTWKQWLAQQYAAGTPVTVYYPLETPAVEQIENWSCTPPITEIKIATTKMVDEEFAAAEAKLATTVQTIESVVSRTIAQTGQIQILQDTKQTRPDENCPANMKCLLVQDEDGTPHWYPIIEP
ncbi:MAG: hypothetical protein MJ164_02695 [Alphaproteobacteria bacterium]|nr:hypothetical protein [Alphaproteobacteria bacterium]